MKTSDNNSASPANDSRSRLRRLIGNEGLDRLDSSYVAVFGLGGVGASCTEALVRSGIGAFALIDKDEVEPSNINRQAIAFESTIGMRKTDVMKGMALDINPDAKLFLIDDFVNARNIDATMESLFGAFSRKPDYIVDAFDTLSVKALIIQAAEYANIPIISAMGGANKLDPTKFKFAKLSKTQVCPLCREMRKISRDRALPDVDVLYSDEAPQKVIAQEGAQRLDKTELGTMSYIPPVMGQMIAGFVIRKLLQI